MSGVNVAAISEQMQAEMAVKGFRDFIAMYNKLSENCFSRCVYDFTSRSLKNKERGCIENCTSKTNLVSQRVLDRFMELQAISKENEKRS